MIPSAQIERWLQEDLGHHDVTNEVPGRTEGILLAREPGVVAGLDAARAVFEYLDVDCEIPVEEGERVEANQAVLEVTGRARDVLRGERVAVNVVGHASGIATRTRRAVDRAESAIASATDECTATESDDSVRIAATRKTTPGLRGIEKRAVVAGGGDTHRLDLSHMVMIKDNHIAEMGLGGAISHFAERVSFSTKIEVEVEQPDAGLEAAEAGADVVLFDNLSPAATERGVSMLPEETIAEASGGITLEDVGEYATTGVDVISMGSLTHSADSLDFSFQTCP